MGAKSTIIESCTLECLVTETPNKCKYNPCECAKAGDTCGQAYPPTVAMWPTPCTSARPRASCKSRATLARAIKYARLFCGSDFYGTIILCECKGAGKTCSDQHPPSCNFAKDTVVTCPGLTQTPCPDGCVDGECKTGCKCTETGLKCGSSFATKCNFVPNSMYKCTKDGDPILDHARGNKACTKGTPDDTCSDPCKCSSAHDVGPFPFLSVNSCRHRQW